MYVDVEEYFNSCTIWYVIINEYARIEVAI